MSAPGTILESWADPCRQLSRTEFAGRYAHPFLVQEVPDPEEGGADSALQFATVQASSEELGSRPLLGPDMMRHLSVLHVVKRGTRAFEGMVNVGRAENCDIVLDHSSISKFHAFFTREDVDGPHYLTDAGSTNGTFVNDVRLEPHDRHELTPREIVAFGRRFVFRFHLPSTFHELVQLVT